MKKIELLSTLQLECFDGMISDKYREFWMEGLITGEYYLKLCGSGGGGFILGFTRDFTNTESYFRKNGVKLVQVFNSR